MLEHYLEDYSEEQIKELLETIKSCVRRKRYTISLNDNRQENIQFIEDYNITEKKRAEILLSLEYTDFCYGLQNMKLGYEHETLYVFCPQRELCDVEGLKSLIDIYLKFNIIKSKSGEFVFTVSFHKRNKPITYLFR